jgi:Spy/CpxP family protein refolding chaperone
MLRLRRGLGAALLASLLLGTLLNAEQADTKETAKYKGYLPTYWKQLGLTDEQKQNVYKVQGEYRTKIDALETQIRDLKAAEKKELEKILTDGQKTRLKEILASKGPADDKKPDDKKSEDKKKEE